MKKPDTAVYLSTFCFDWHGLTYELNHTESYVKPAHVIIPVFTLHLCQRKKTLTKKIIY